jgi:nicotinamidase-related amidase
MTRQALLIIDVQEALCSGPDECHDIPRLLQVVNSLSARARQSANALVVIVQHEEPDSSFERGSPGWKLARLLDTAKDDILVSKKTPDSFHDTTLLQTLQDHSVGGLIVCGLQSDYCIDSTTRRAMALGYNVQLVQDGHSTEGNGVLDAAQIIAHHNATLAGISSFAGRATLVEGSKVQF